MTLHSMAGRVVVIPGGVGMDGPGERQKGAAGTPFRRLRRQLRTQSPDFPPCFSRTQIPSITIALSIAFAMS